MTSPRQSPGVRWDCGPWVLGGCRVTPQGMDSPRDAPGGSRRVRHRERECRVRVCYNRTTLVHKVDRSPDPVPYYVEGGVASFTSGSSSNHESPNRIPWIRPRVGVPRPSRV